MRPLLLLAAVLAVLAVPACGPAAPTDDEHPDAGSHTLQVTGETVLTPALDERVSGRALFAAVSVGLPGGGTARRFVVELQDAGPDPFLLVDVTFPTEAPPAVGTFAAGTSAVAVELVQSQASPSYTERFTAEAGTVTLTEVSASRVVGSLDVRLRVAGYSAPGGTVVHARGTFSAVPGRL